MAKYEDKLNRIMEQWDDDQASEGMTLRELVAEGLNTRDDDLVIDADGDIHDGRRWLDPEARDDLAEWLCERCGVSMPGEYRAYDPTSDWQGPVRETYEAAARDADERNRGAAEQGGYGTTTVVARCGDRCVWPHSGCAPVWRPHWWSCGAVKWAE